MAKNIIKKKTRVMVKPKKAKARKAGDGGAEASRVIGHARMIVDPCNAPLTDPVYGNSAASIRTRLKCQTMASHTPASTAATYGFALFYHPTFGCYSTAVSVGDPNPFVVQGTGCAVLINASLSPSYGATLGTRALGGCLAMSWGGTELTRKGILHYGVVPGSYVHQFVTGAQGGQGTSLYIETLAAQLAGTCRMPNDKLEVNWVPTDADAEYKEQEWGTTTSTSGIQAGVFNRANFAVILLVCSQAVGETVSIQCKTVGIVEKYGTDTNDQIVIDGAHVPPVATHTSVTDIIRTLQKRDSAWYVNAFQKAGALLGRGLASYASGGVLGLVGEVASMAIGPRKNVSSG